MHCTDNNLPKISIIIPNFNGSKTLPFCLDAAIKSDYPLFEVIVVDDASTDKSKEKILGFNVKLLTHTTNRGPSAARNTGARHADGKIFLFIDSDVCIKKDTLGKIAAIFLKKPEISAAVGLPDHAYVFTNLASIHFNQRVHYNYLQLPDFINVLYGSVSAVKKEAFEKVGGFNEAIRTAGVEDNELGYRLVNAGYKLYHSKDIPITHYKKIGFIALFKNDFKRTVERMKLLLGRKLVKRIIAERRFITSPLYQLISPFVAFLWVLLSLISIFHKSAFLPSLLFLIIFLVLNSGYLSFNLKREGVLFCIKLFFLLLIDMFIVSLAIAQGAIIFFVKGEKY